MQIWSITYSLRFGSIKIHKHCVYWKVFITEIYKKDFLQMFATFLATLFGQ